MRIYFILLIFSGYFIGFLTNLAVPSFQGSRMKWGHKAKNPVFASNSTAHFTNFIPSSPDVIAAITQSNHSPTQLTSKTPGRDWPDAGRVGK